jgi:hypothetical protein
MEVITIKRKVKPGNVENYIKSLTEIERITMEIAKQHLGSSFDIRKSNGYLNYINGL